MEKIRDYVLNKMPGELMVSVLIMLIIAIVFTILGIAIKKADPKKPPKGLAFLADWLAEKTTNTIDKNLGNVYEIFTPYLIFLVTYIPMAFVSGLFGLASPMTYFTIPLCLALVTWIGIQASAIRFQKLDYLKGFTSPLPVWLPVFVPINILSKFSSLMSLSIRMFGNALAGYILMWLVYWGFGKLAFLVFGNASYNFFALIVTPFLHAYFDAFGAFVQTLIFVSLTMLLIAAEIPAPVNKIKKYK